MEKTLGIFVLGLALGVGGAWLLIHPTAPSPAATASSPIFHLTPYPSGPLGKEIAQGAALYQSTSLGTNGLSCDSCHAGMGTVAKRLSGGLVAPRLVGVAALFPMVKKGHVITLAQQLEGCIQKGLKGQPLPLTSKRLTALETYVTWLSHGQAIRM